jgi:hypothetical protein
MLEVRLESATLITSELVRNRLEFSMFEDLDLRIKPYVQSYLTKQAIQLFAGNLTSKLTGLDEEGKLVE